MWALPIFLTRRIASFTSRDWQTDHDGYHTIVYTMEDFKESMYFRLRGTNLPCGAANQTGPVTALPSADYCRPLPDALEGISTDATVNAQKAFGDLWFYSNPIFAYVNQLR